MELLVVMVITMILLVAVVPIFMKSDQRARQSASDLVAGHLQRVRSHAIATGTSTALVISDYSASNTIAGKMIGIAEVNWVSDPNGNGGTYEVTKVLQRWEALPGKMLVMPQSTTAHPRPSIMEQALLCTVILSGNSITGVVIVFSPLGQIVSPHAGTMEILLGQGTMDSGTITATEKTGDRVSYDILQINRLTGRARQIEPL